MHNTLGKGVTSRLPECLGYNCEPLQELVVEAFLNKNTRTGGASLAYFKKQWGSFGEVQQFLITHIEAMIHQFSNGIEK